MNVVLFQVDHPLVKGFVAMEETPVTAQTASSNAPVIAECYKVTADVLPILSKFGYE